MNTRFALASALGVVALAAPATAYAPAISVVASQFTVDIVGFVPVICRATVDATTVSPSAGTVQLGSLKEFCNSPNGYRVHADYSPGLAQAKLVVGGRQVPLRKAGTSVVAQSNRAGIESNPISLELPKGVNGGSISFRIEPL
jgi:hypothetical protein